MALKTFGLMGVDWEERVNLERLRQDRLSRIKAALKKSETGRAFMFRHEQHPLHHRHPHRHLGHG